MPAGADEDEVVFREESSEGSRLRVLRGRIIKEDEEFLHLERRDGIWSIRKRLIERIYRHRRP